MPVRSWLLLACCSLLGGCNRHDVPLGGACERGEDCDTTALTCLEANGATKGICSKPCSLGIPGAQIQPGGKTCEQAGLVCEKAAKPHPILGEAYCVKKP